MSPQEHKKWVCNKNIDSSRILFVGSKKGLAALVNIDLVAFSTHRKDEGIIQASEPLTCNKDEYFVSVGCLVLMDSVPWLSLFAKQR